MATYDGTGAAVQLGGDLQEFSSNGCSWIPGTGSPAENPHSWDATAGWGAEGIFWLGGASSLVDVCVHQGEVYVVWVEPQWDGSRRVPRGPYVKKWDGSAWVAVGGEVEPDVTACDLEQMFAYTNNPDPYPQPFSIPFGTSGPTAPLQPFESKFFPGRPRIVSDGTDLYVAYTVRVVDAAPNTPAGGSWTDGLATFPGTTVSGSMFSLWTARWAYVRRWTGSDWELYGQVAPATNNTHWKPQNNVVDARGWYTPTLDVACSDAEPGVVYVGIAENGLTNTVWRWKGPPVTFFVGFVFGTDHYPGVTNRFAVARFDGSDVNGDVHELVANITSPTDNPTTQIANVTAYTDDQSSGAGVASSVTGNQGGTPFVFYRPPAGADSVMQRLTDDAVVQTDTDHLTGAGESGNMVAIGWLDGVFYLGSVSSSVRATMADDDGAGPFEKLDGSDVAWQPESPPNIDATGDPFLRMITDGPNDIWTVCTGQRLNLYHRPCGPLWEFQQDVPPDPAAYGAPAGAVAGDDAYVAAATFDPDDLTSDLRIRVFRVPILRDVFTCGGPATPRRLTLQTEPHSLPFVAGTNVQVPG